ncbi:hypothetical protein [Halalkalicoccus salilacus]|uniref:hypothetical protein n=1 Tax=Halalkalicoccus TaxID=332246 RepID=UPI002F9613F1
MAETTTGTAEWEMLERWDSAPFLVAGGRRSSPRQPLELRRPGDERSASPRSIPLSFYRFDYRR